MKKILSILLFVSASAGAATLPNSSITPGGNDVSVTRQVSVEELCTTSTKLVRNVSESTKQFVYSEYGLSGNHTGYCKDESGAKDQGCEIDHLCSLELGCNNDAKNLWPQPYFGACNAHHKDKLENKLHAMICGGEISIEQAQKEISTNWIESYKKRIDSKGCGL